MEYLTAYGGVYEDANAVVLSLSCEFSQHFQVFISVRSGSGQKFCQAPASVLEQRALLDRRHTLGMNQDTTADNTGVYDGAALH